jgi:hypothetical protein
MIISVSLNTKVEIVASCGQPFTFSFRNRIERIPNGKSLPGFRHVMDAQHLHPLIYRH